MFPARFTSSIFEYRTREVQRKTWFRVFCLLFIIVTVCSEQRSDAQEVVIDTVREYNVKGAFLYSFGRYTSWPSYITDKEEEPFVIGVYGDAPITRILRRIELTKKRLFR